MKNLPIGLKNNIIYRIGLFLTGLSILLGFMAILVIIFFSQMAAFFGKYALFFVIILAAGIVLTLLGFILILLGKGLDLALKSILLGSLFNLVFGIPSLLGLFLLHRHFLEKNVCERKVQEYLVWISNLQMFLTLPILLIHASFIPFIAELEDRTHIPFNWFGRDGYYFTQTIWDVNVFWGEFWYSLMVIFLFSGMLMPIARRSLNSPLSLTINSQLLSGNNPKYAADLSPEILMARRRRLMLAAIPVNLAVIVSMLITWDRSFPIWENWFPTQFAYMLLHWPALIAFMYLTVLKIFRPQEIHLKGVLSNVGAENRVNQNNHRCMENHTGSLKMGPETFFIIIFLVIWLYLSLISDFHLHAVLNFNYNIQYAIFTMGFVVSLTGFILRSIYIHKKPSNPDIHDGDWGESSAENFSGNVSDGNGMNKINGRKNKILLARLYVIFGFVIILLTQYLSSFSYPYIGSERMFSGNLYWWWAISHWPNYVFIVSSVIIIYAGYEYAALKRIISGNIPTNNAENNAENDTNGREKPRGGGRIKKRSFSFFSTIRRSIRVLAPQNKKAVSALRVSFILVIVSISFIIPVYSAVDEYKSRSSPMLLINQVGYLPGSPKKVVFQYSGGINFGDSVNFYIFDSNDNIVYSGKFQQKYYRYGNSYLMGNFSALTKSGKYYIRARVLGKWYTGGPFYINESVYDRAIELALRFFYYQRCNYEVKEVVKGYKGHHICHMDDALVWNGTGWQYHDLTGGWHDAGDYNKYNSWFQTQWYCVEGLSRLSLTNPGNILDGIPNLYDSPFVDSLDESLWGLKFLVNSINREGIGGNECRYLVWEAVSGYRQESSREARMSYWGPPEKDWTTPRHVAPNRYNTSFVGVARGYQIAAMMLRSARLVENYMNKFPDYELPEFFKLNVSELRDLGEKVFIRYSGLQNESGLDDDVSILIGKLLYEDERSYITSDFGKVDSIINKSLPLIPERSTYHLWFGWAGYYLMSQILLHYLDHNRTIPEYVKDKIYRIQEDNFKTMFDGPFNVKHVRYNGSNELFYGAERQTDMQTNVWLESLIYSADKSLGNLTIIQSYLDWLFGVNPVGYSLMEGMGYRNLPQYHHRYNNAFNPGGKVPGAIPNGIALAMPTREMMARDGLDFTEENVYIKYGDRGWVADWPANHLAMDGVPSNPNEVWIPHDAMFLNILNVIYKYRIFGT